MRLCVPHAHSLSCNVLDFFGERQTELLANKLCVKSVKRLLISVGIPKVHLTKAQPLMRFYTYSNPISSTSACADLMEFSSGKLKIQSEPIRNEDSIGWWDGRCTGNEVYLRRKAD